MMFYNNTLRSALKNPNILWDSILTGSTVAASTETSGAVGDNAITQDTAGWWIPTAAPATLTCTLSAAKSADTAGFAAHTLSGKTVYVEYYSGSAWVTAATVTPTDNDPFMVAFASASSAQWRVRVTGGTFALGVVYIGAALVMPGSVQVPHTPLNLCETVTLLDGNLSRNGQFLQSEIEMVSGTATVTFEVQTPSFVINSFNAFRQWFNRGNAFFVACAPTAWPQDMGYVWRDGDEIVPPFRDAVFMDVAMKVRVYRG